MTFTSGFSYGNGKLVDYRCEEEYEYVSFIAEQKFSEAKPIWFYFSIHGLVKNRAVFHIANAHQFLMDETVDKFTGDAPVYRAVNGQWKRCRKCTVKFEEDGFPNVEFVIENCPSDVEVAFCYPYGLEQLNETMDHADGFTKRCIGYSTKGSPIYRYATDGGSKTNKPGIYFLCRQHAQEVGGAWVLNGILKYFGSEEGRKYRERLTIWTNPMVDMDGVLNGAYGKDQAIGDMNRAWTEKFQKRTEIDCAVQDLERWSERCTPKIIMDLHSPAHEVLDMLVNVNLRYMTDEHRRELENFIERINCELEETGLEEFRANYVAPTIMGSSQGGGQTLGIYCQERFHLAEYILEMTYQGSRNGRLYEIEDYEKYGKYVAITLAKILLGEYRQ